MNRSTLVAAVFLNTIVASSLAQNAIVSWGDGTIGTDFLINDATGTITILRGNTNTY